MGLGKGKLVNPWGIAIDDKDYVYISEPGIQRVSIFTKTGRFLCHFHTHGEDEESAGSTFSLCALAIDKSGNLYACKPISGQVVIF